MPNRRRSLGVPPVRPGPQALAADHGFSRRRQSAAPSLVNVGALCLPEGGLVPVLVKTPQLASESEEPGARIPVDVDR